MTAWQFLNLKGVGATAFAILLQGIVAANAWDALVQKSSAPNGSTAWVHLISVLDQVPVVPQGGEMVSSLRRQQLLREDDELLLIIRALLEKL